MSRRQYFARRLGYLVPTALGVTILVFFMIHLIPGNPARIMLGARATPAGVAALDARFGLNHSLFYQYGLFMQRLVSGSLGTSLVYNTSVTSLIGGRLEPTLWLLVGGTILTIVITVPLAVAAALNRGRAVDQVVRAVPLVGLGMPGFWVGIVLILLLGLDLHIFPVAGFGSGIGGHLKSMFLPSLTVALAIAPLTIRSLRVALIEAFDSDYVVTARAKGIPERRVVFRHALRNAVGPALTVLGVNMGWLVGATVVIEQVFSLPGLGSLMLSAIAAKDFPVVQGITLVFAVLVVLINLLTDLCHSLLDPRVRLG